MRAALVALLLLLEACSQAGQSQSAQTTQTGPALPFDYWLLSLSWSPQFCSDHDQDPQCQRSYAFVVHGLWPQNEKGYPQNCGEGRGVDRDLVARMLPLMPSPRLIQHEWLTHGICSTLLMDEYFATIERAYHKVVIPQVYQNPGDYISTTAEEIQRNFLAANPGLSADRISLQCSGRYLREVRVCFDKNLQFRNCGSDVDDRCREQIVLRPSR